MQTEVNTIKPYVYKIGWTHSNMWYIGSRIANKVPAKNDLMIKYFTSSKYVKSYIKIHGAPDYIEIISEYECKKEAVLQEYLLIVNENAVYDEKYFNMRAYYGDLPEHCVSGKQTEEHKQKRIKGLQKYWEDQGQINRMTGNKSMTGQIRSEEEKRKTSISGKLKWQDPEHREKVLNSQKDITRACPYCGYVSRPCAIGNHKKKCSLRPQ